MELSSGRNMLAYSDRMTAPWSERQNTSKIAAAAAASAERGFASGAAEMVRKRVKCGKTSMLPYRKEHFHAL